MIRFYTYGIESRFSGNLDPVSSINIYVAADKIRKATNDAAYRALKNRLMKNKGNDVKNVRNKSVKDIHNIFTPDLTATDTFKE